VRRNADPVPASKGCVKSMSRTTAPKGAAIFSTEKGAEEAFMAASQEKKLSRVVRPISNPWFFSVCMQLKMNRL
jgi:hypothetical protein